MKDFDLLVQNIETVHLQLQRQAANAINTMLTVRNWLIGFYIVEYEQQGLDKSEYGTGLLAKLASKCSMLKGMDERTLRNFRRFYIVYPQVSEIFAPKSNRRSLTSDFITHIDTVRLHTSHNSFVEHDPIPSEVDKKILIAGEMLITRLSYTHIEQLIKIDDPLKRCFYEIEAIKSTWSVRELKRQMSSLYFDGCRKRFSTCKVCNCRYGSTNVCSRVSHQIAITRTA